MGNARFFPRLNFDAYMPSFAFVVPSPRRGKELKLIASNATEPITSICAAH